MRGIYILKKNNNLILVLCGSASSWIEKNILGCTGFLGRISYTLTLGELSLMDCQQFWGKSLKNVSAYEILKVLSVTGGIPKYLEEIICEIKFSKNEIGSEIISEVQQKIDQLKRPKGFSYRPVLIHASEVNNVVHESDFFAEIIDFCSLIKQS